jgi:hypothetical protein
MRAVLHENVVRIAYVPYSTKLLFALHANLFFLLRKIERLNQPLHFKHESDGLY